MLLRFMKESKGSIAVLAALLLVPVTMAAGMAVDFTRGISARADLQSAADAAALKLLKMSDANQEELEAAALSMVKNNLDSAIKLDTLAIEVVRTDDGDMEVDLDVTLDAYFMQISGFPTLDISTRSVASADQGEFVDVFLMIDRSASMLIARPGADMTAMLNLTRPMIAGTPTEAGEPDGCAFACHRADPWQSDGIPLLDHARANDIGLRIDTVTDAATTMVEALLSSTSRNIRVGVLDFSEETVLSLAPSSDMDAIKTALAGSNVASERSHYHTLFDFVTDNLGAQGTGATSNDPRKLLILITDGVYSQLYTDGTVRPNATHHDVTENDDTYYEVFDPTVCEDAIAQGFEISVLNTIYYPLLNSDNYDVYVSPYADEIDDMLKGCVTRDYIEATSTADIEAAFVALTNSFEESKTRLVE